MKRTSPMKKIFCTNINMKMVIILLLDLKLFGRFGKECRPTLAKIYWSKLQ